MSTTRRRRPALIALAALAASGCMLLAWWQWTRYESNSGTFLNLGYALQWPMFAAFCVYAYFKFVRLEEAPPTYEPSDSERATEIPAGLLRRVVDMGQHYRPRIQDLAPMNSSRRAVAAFRYTAIM